MITSLLTAPMVPLMTVFACGSSAIAQTKLSLNCKLNGRGTYVVSMSEQNGYVSELIGKSSMYAAYNTKTRELTLAQSYGDRETASASGALGAVPVTLSVSAAGLPNETITCKKR